MIHKYLPALLVSAMLCFCLGLAIFYVEQQLNLTIIVFSSLSALLFIVYVRISPKRSRYYLEATSWKNKLFILSKTMVFFGVIVLINYFAYQYSPRWDVTQNKQHTLSVGTVNFIKGINKPVELTAFYVGFPPKYLQDMFKEYERVSNGYISSTIIDPIKQIGYAAKFGGTINAKERKVFVRSGKNIKEVDFTESSLAERKLSNAIASVSRDVRQVYFLTGHKERSLSSKANDGFSTFVQLLADNNINSKELMLGITKSIPKDCDVLIIAGPKIDLTEEETALITEYLEFGGDALFLIEQTLLSSSDHLLTEEEINKSPSLNNILNSWGIDIQTDIVIDLSSHVGKDVGSPATKNYGPHKALTEGLDYTFYVRPRSIHVLDKRRPLIKLAPVVFTASTEKSWGETDRSLNILFNPGIDTPGPVPISYVIFEEKEQGDISDTRIIVFTDSDFLTNAYINQYSNAKMGLNVTNWLAELDDSILVESKEIKVERLDLTSKQKRQVMVILWFFPILLAIWGIAVWLRSKP